MLFLNIQKLNSFNIFFLFQRKEEMSREVFNSLLEELKKEEELEGEIYPIKDVYKLEEMIEECESHKEENFYQIFFYKEEPILVSGKDSQNFYHTDREYLVKDLETAIVHPKIHFKERLMYIILKGLSGGRILFGYFEKDFKDFLGKLYYYIELPIDPFTLKEMGVDLDLSATSIKAFKY
jgi:hypothetical protein